MDKTQALYTCILVFTVKLLAHTLFGNLDIAALDLAILKLISGSRERFALMVDSRH
jgi:hypothetical protein